MKKITQFDLSKKLKSQRKKIDLIDQKLLSLLDQRLRIAMEIGKIKRQMGAKIYDTKRKKEILKRLRLRLRSINKSSLKEKGVEEIFRTIIRVCRRVKK